MSPTAPERPEPPADPRRARSRRKLLDATVELLANEGIEAVTVDAVTHRSGVARTTLYRNFPSAQALIAAAFGELLPRASAPTGGTPRERALDLTRRQYELMLTAPMHESLLAWMAMGMGADDELGDLHREVVDRYLEPLSGVLDDAVAEGRIDPADRDLAIVRLAGPLIASRLIGLPALTDPQIERVVDDVFGPDA